MGLVEIKIHHQDVCLLLSGRQKHRRTDNQGFMLRVQTVYLCCWWEIISTMGKITFSEGVFGTVI